MSRLWYNITTKGDSQGQNQLKYLNDHLSNAIKGFYLDPLPGRELTTDFLWTAGSFFQHVQHILALSLTQRYRAGAAVRLNSHHRAILHTLVQTTAAKGAVPDLAGGPGVTLVICAHWTHRDQVNTHCVSLGVLCSLPVPFSSLRRVITVSLTTAVLSYTERGVSAVQNSSIAAHTLLSDEGAGSLLVVISVQTGAAGAGAHTWLVFLSRGAPQCCRMTGT